MAYDEGLAQRIEEYFNDRADFEVKKMFGGLCFMVNGHMCCGIVKDQLMARVGADQYEACLQKAFCKEMDFTGKAMKGMVYVDAQGISEEDELHGWIQTCEDLILTLPPKAAKPSKKKTSN